MPTLLLKGDLRNIPVTGLGVTTVSQADGSLVITFDTTAIVGPALEQVRFWAINTGGAEVIEFHLVEPDAPIAERYILQPNGPEEQGSAIYTSLWVGDAIALSIHNPLLNPMP